MYILISRLFNALRWNGKFMLSPSVSLLIYTSPPLSLSLSASVYLLTPPTPSSVVSYSAHVLILLLHPHILQTLAKFWLYSCSLNRHSHSRIWTRTFEAKRHESLSKCHSAIDWMTWWSQLSCPRRARPVPLGNFPDRPKASTQPLRAIYITVCSQPITHSSVTKWAVWFHKPEIRLLKDAAMLHLNDQL